MVFYKNRRSEIPMREFILSKVVGLQPVSLLKNKVLENHSKIHAFFNKQHFYKQHQAEIGKKSSKC